MAQQPNITPIDDMKHSVFERLEHAFALLLRQHPELETSLRAFRLELRFHAFLRMNMRRFDATPNELARATGIPVASIIFRAEHVPTTDFWSALNEDERKWLNEFLVSGKSLRQT